MIRFIMRVLIILLFVLALVPITLAEPSGEVSACGFPIENSGHGAVQLCNVFYTCGAADGVCPEDYSDGTLENRSERMEVMMYYGYPDRPDTSSFTDNSLIYNTGLQACEVIGGGCQSIQYSDDYGENWQALGSVSCSTNIDGNPNVDNVMVKAVCNNVPRTASCSLCPDPDCLTSVRGVVYDVNSSQPLDNAGVVFTTPTPGIDYSTRTDEEGAFGLNTARGNLTVMCGADGYFPINKDGFFIRGENIIDCPLQEAQCTADCALPNAFGEMICRSDCQGRGGCEYDTYTTSDFSGDDTLVTYNASELCDGARQGTFRRVGRINSTHVFGADCCSNGFIEKKVPLFNLDAENVRNLLTRNYLRLLDDEPVTLKIIVYDRDE